MGKIARGEDGQDGAEQFALHERMLRVVHLKNGGRDKPAVGFRFAAIDDSARPRRVRR